MNQAVVFLMVQNNLNILGRLLLSHYLSNTKNIRHDAKKIKFFKFAYVAMW